MIRLAVVLQVRFSLTLRNVGDLLHERGIDASHERVRFQRNRLGASFAGEIRLTAPLAPVECPENTF